MLGCAICVGVAALLPVGCGPSPAEKKRAVEAATQDRLKWEQKNLTEAYLQAGHTDPKWDEPAKTALDELARFLAGVTGAEEDAPSIISNNCVAAVGFGCDDPLIRYLDILYAMPESEAKETFAEAFCQAAIKLEESSYPPIRRFYAWLRVNKQVTYTYGYGTNIPKKYNDLSIWSRPVNDFGAATSDPSMPPDAIYEAASQLLDLWQGDKDRYASIYQQLLSRVKDKRAKSEPMLLLKAQANIDMAWQARGGGYADSVSADGWKQFGNHIKIAESALNDAWDLNPKDSRIAVKMLTVELAQGKDRDRMELWFKRAMTIDPDNYDACYAKLTYLEPKWHGSIEDMLDFGRECVTNQLWGGHVPLILMEAHRAIQSQYVDKPQRDAYWSQPLVWKDVSDAFERFFEINPRATGWYQNYAWYAYQAKQWTKFTELIPKLGEVNYKLFGGKENFDTMVARAREQAHHS